MEVSKAKQSIDILLTMKWMWVIIVKAKYYFFSKPFIN